MPEQRPSILWFRDDLRLADQPAVHAAAARGAATIVLYIDDTSSRTRAPGGASRWWLHHSLKALAADLNRRGGVMHILRGDACELVPALATASNASNVYWTRRYGGAEVAIDTHIKAELKQTGVEACSYNGQLLLEPWEVMSKSGAPYRVFTPYWRASREHYVPLPALPAPKKLASAQWPDHGPQRLTLDELALLPEKPNWATGLRANWKPGEAGALQRLRDFTAGSMKDYADGRDFADRQSTSRLSPHLRFGEISPGQIWRTIEHARESGGVTSRNADKFLSEIGWREFSYHLLFYNPGLATKNFNARFDEFPWGVVNETHIRAWQRGLTGYPIVDAGMRELWQTGTMHNRVRMITASFLIKHLMTDWRTGEAWFWDTLCDADPANNASNWQWVAGSGADAAPYFRIFNPIIQGEKFDPKGDYVRKYVPELRNLDTKYIHKPWTAPMQTLHAAGISLAANYPAPIVDHAAARARALAAFAGLNS